MSTKRSDHKSTTPGSQKWVQSYPLARVWFVFFARCSVQNPALKSHTGITRQPYLSPSARADAHGLEGDHRGVHGVCLYH